MRDDHIAQTSHMTIEIINLDAAAYIKPIEKCPALDSTYFVVYRDLSLPTEARLASSHNQLRPHFLLLCLIGRALSR